IREITPAGDVSTFAGLPGADGAMDGSLQSARFRSPAELTFDRNGNLFVADSMNQIIREIGTNGLVQTISGLPGVFGATNGVNGQGRFFNPYGLAFEPDGSLIVSDTYNEMIRLVTVPFMIAVQQSEGNKLVLSWDSVIGRNYQVQYMTSADCAIWSNLDAPVTAACPILVQTDSIASSSGKIYRVIILQ
ncbi:MAG: hypothetical protein KGR98_00595, partial [Verrucomicrobia bacterium]|nr:hypothetical protein [Verrucomicrobiota bacterium]